jgi:hypothetical protein
MTTTLHVGIGGSSSSLRHENVKQIAVPTSQRVALADGEMDTLHLVEN